MSSSSTPQHIFQPLPPRGLRAPPPVYHQPVLVTTYSHLPDRAIVHNDESMAYYRRAPIGADLNYGFERKIERDEDEEEHLDGLCAALKHRAEAGGQGERKGGIITWRGMITRIMTAPFEDRDDEKWEMTAIALDGSIYIELFDPPDVRKARRKKQSSWAWQTYMGYSYEAFSTAPASDVAQEGNEDSPEGWSGDVNTNVQWCNVIRSSIGEIPLCLGGEVDCVDAPPGTPHPGLEKCVELKTNMVIRNEKQERTFHKKLLKHWAQSWLLGVPTIEVGFRDDRGIVQSQRTFDTLHIPRFIASLPSPPWNPDASHHFLRAVLALLLKHVLPTDPKPSGGIPPGAALPPAEVWRFSFIPRQGCELYRVGEEGGERWGGVLDPEYVRWRMEMH